MAARLTRLVVALVVSLSAALPSAAAAIVRLTPSHETATSIVPEATVSSAAAQGAPPTATSGTPPRGAVEYVHVDALGSVRAATDEGGARLRRHDYLPFGEEWRGPSGAPGGGSRSVSSNGAAILG